MDDQPDRAGKQGAEPARYDQDLYSWAVEQAALLRAGRIAEADALNIAEELDDVGNEQYDKLESALRLILVHLLKWDHQPGHRSRSWWSTITVQRNQVRRILRKNPGLKPQIDTAVVEAYEDARIQAAAQTRIDPDNFGARCPYSFDEIMNRPIAWPASQ
jgi:predicted  nucleic acid-binding Zn-ribbon protein